MLRAVFIGDFCGLGSQRRMINAGRMAEETSTLVGAEALSPVSSNLTGGFALNLPTGRLPFYALSSVGTLV